jgi:anti-sigma-K factor RskA
MTDRDHDILAGEYALGTLDARDRARAEVLMASDRDFARAVRTWERWLAPLSEAETPVAPPRTAWAKIEAALSNKTPATSTILSDLASQVAEMKRSLTIWRYATVGAVAAAVAMALVWVGGYDSPFRPAPLEERYVAMLQNDRGETGFVITMNMDGKQFAIRPVAARTPRDKSYELWCILSGDKPAMTAGLVGTEAYAMMDIPAPISKEELEKGVNLAISLEPQGGAPSGKSMGPIMYAGLLIKQTP